MATSSHSHQFIGQSYRHHHHISWAEGQGPSQQSQGGQAPPVTQGQQRASPQHENPMWNHGTFTCHQSTSTSHIIIHHARPNITFPPSYTFPHISQPHHTHMTQFHFTTPSHPAQHSSHQAIRQRISPLVHHATPADSSQAWQPPSFIIQHMRPKANSMTTQPRSRHSRSSAVTSSSVAPSHPSQVQGAVSHHGRAAQVWKGQQLGVPAGTGKPSPRHSSFPRPTPTHMHINRHHIMPSADQHTSTSATVEPTAMASHTQSAQPGTPPGTAHFHSSQVHHSPFPAGSTRHSKHPPHVSNSSPQAYCMHS